MLFHRLRRNVAALALAIVGGSLAASPSAHAITLTVVPNTRGVNNAFQITGATPGGQVYLTYGFTPAATPKFVPGCGVVYFRMAPVKLAASGFANGAGSISWNFNVPPAGSPPLIIVQALDRPACQTSVPTFMQ